MELEYYGQLTVDTISVAIVMEGLRSEVSCNVKEFGLERADALRCSSTEALMRSMQPWSGAGAGGLLPIFLTLWQQSLTYPW